MGIMENPGSAGGATGAEQSGQSFTSLAYRLRAERATTLSMAIAECVPEDAAPILYAAIDAFHRQGFPASADHNLMAYALDWADHATERELKGYAIAAARRMAPATREAFVAYLRGVA